MKLKQLNRSANPSHINEFKIQCNYENKHNPYAYLLVSMNDTKFNEIVFKIIEDCSGYKCIFTREETQKIIEVLALYLNSKSFTGVSPQTYLQIDKNADYYFLMASRQHKILTDIENDLYERVINMSVSVQGYSVYIDDNDAQALLFTLKSWVKQLEFAEAYEKALEEEDE